MAIPVTIYVRTTLRNALAVVPAPVMAWMIDSGYIEEWPFEITPWGKKHIKVVFKR